MQSLDIYKNGSLFVTIKPDEGSTQTKAVMGDNVLNLSFTLSFYADFSIGDYCTAFGEKYKVYDMPVVVKQSSIRYVYTMAMKVEGYDLGNAQFLFLDNLNNFTEPSFSINGDLITFADLVVKNANRVQPGEWEVGTVDITGFKNLTFDKENCYNALSKIAEEFKTEFWIIGKTIHLVKKRRDTGYLFKQGRYKGLYEVQRTNANDSSIVTRLYAYGAEKNLPPNYLSRRLRLPSVGVPCLVANVTVKFEDNGNGNQTLTFNFSPATATGVSALTLMYRKLGDTVFANNTAGNTSGRQLVLPLGAYEVKFRAEGACNGVTTGIITVDGADITVPQFPFVPIQYLEKNVSKYGLIEYVEYFDEVFPHRTGKVTSVNASDVYKFIDTTIDFNLNDYFLPGVAGKVTFNSGQLSGYTFDLRRYDDATKEITILKNKDERSIEVPSIAFRAAIGDEYVFVDIQMPQAYVEAAELELLAKATALLDRVSQPQVTYSFKTDPVFMKNSGWLIYIGDEVWLKDEAFSVDRKIRVVQMVRSILNEYDIQLTVSDIVSAGTISRIITNTANNSTNINNLNSFNQNNAVFNNNIIGDLKIEQGGIIGKDFPAISNTSGLQLLYIDPVSGKVYRKT